MVTKSELLTAVQDAAYKLSDRQLVGVSRAVFWAWMLATPINVRSTFTSNRPPFQKHASNCGNRVELRGFEIPRADQTEIGSEQWKVVLM